MSRFSIIWTIALREFREQVRSRTFRIGTALTVLVVVAAVVLPGIMSGDDDRPTHRIGVVQPVSEEVVDAIERTGTVLNADVNISEYYVTKEAGEAGLRDEAVMLLVVPGKEIVSRVAPDPTRVSSEARVASVLGETLRLYSGLQQAGLSPSAAAQALAHETLPIRGLESAEERNEKDIQASSTGMILLFVFLTLYGAFVLNSVVEEKTSRVVEILLATVKPFDLLTGKVLGIGMVGSVQAAALVVAALVSRQLSTGGDEALITPAVLGYTMLWFALGFFLYAGLYACAGALVSRAVDAQSLVMPVQVPLIISYIAGLYVSINGDNAVVTTLSMIPFTAPMTMMGRMAAGDAEVWQIAFSVTATFLTALVVIRLAVTIFAGGILRSGQRVKVLDAWRNPVG